MSNLEQRKMAITALTQEYVRQEEWAPDHGEKFLRVAWWISKQKTPVDVERPSQSDIYAAAGYLLAHAPVSNQPWGGAFQVVGDELLAFADAHKEIHAHWRK